jgi:mono/diheme cytochrome c family protein
MILTKAFVPRKQLAVALLPFVVLALPMITHSAFARAVPSNHSPTWRGAAIYQKYCASCHGVSGKGDGPVAPAFKVPPPDLTTISQRAGGKFPAARVVRTITYGENISAHGNQAMPVWGTVFSAEAGRGRRSALHSRKAVIRLTRYLESIQQR